MIIIKVLFVKVLRQSGREYKLFSTNYFLLSEQLARLPFPDAFAVICGHVTNFLAKEH